MVLAWTLILCGSWTSLLYDLELLGCICDSLTSLRVTWQKTMGNLQALSCLSRGIEAESAWKHSWIVSSHLSSSLLNIISYFPQPLEIFQSNDDFFTSSTPSRKTKEWLLTPGTNAIQSHFVIGYLEVLRLKIAGINILIFLAKSPLLATKLSYY